MHARKIHSKL